MKKIINKSKKKNIIIIFSLVFIIISFYLIYNYSSFALNIREKNLRSKLHNEIEQINYCDVKEDCAIGCIWDYSNAGCGTPYFYNVDESNKKIERYRSKISDLIIKQGKDKSQINCLVNVCDEVLRKELYTCENNICLRI
jgi:hypothetical protein